MLLENFIIKSVIKITILMSIVSLFTFSSCEENSVTAEARLTTMEDLMVQPGFAWFVENKNKYTPNPTVINELKNKQIEDKIFLFVKPSCGCVGTKQRFPEFMKIIEESGIPKEKYEIYFMGDESDKHPYQTKITIKDLPSFYVKRGDNYISLVEDYDKRKNTNPNITLEEVFLDALK